jgi:hypothetical protein
MSALVLAAQLLAVMWAVGIGCVVLWVCFRLWVTRGDR